MSSVVGGRGTITGRTTAGEYRGTSMTRTAVPARSAAARSACAARRQAVEHQILRRPRRGLSLGSGASIGSPQRGHEGPLSWASIPGILKRPDEKLLFRDLSAKGVMFGEGRKLGLPKLRWGVSCPGEGCDIRTYVATDVATSRLRLRVAARVWVTTTARSGQPPQRRPGCAWFGRRQWLPYSSRRRIQIWAPSASSRPFGTRSRIG
jgi:hypothetical protein